jgi:hypothetical protein
MRLIGAGLGRTGTRSLKDALELVGFVPCYHMREIADHADHAQTWLAAARGQEVDFDTVLGGFAACVDWPACAFWRELMVTYPEAPVLLSVRPPGEWLASFDATIRALLLRPRNPDVPPVRWDMTREVIVERTFGGRIDDDAAVVDAYERHNAQVIAEVPSERLLVFNVSEGWGPLCRFLGCEVPGEPFPRGNETAAFQARYLEAPESK